MGCTGDAGVPGVDVFARRSKVYVWFGGWVGVGTCGNGHLVVVSAAERRLIEVLTVEVVNHPADAFLQGILDT